MTREYLRTRITSENYTNRFIFEKVTATECWEENHIQEMKASESSPCKLIFFQKPFPPEFCQNLGNRAKLVFQSWQLEVQGHGGVLSK